MYSIHKWMNVFIQYSINVQYSQMNECIPSIGYIMNVQCAWMNECIHSIQDECRPTVFMNEWIYSFNTGWMYSIHEWMNVGLFILYSLVVACWRRACGSWGVMLQRYIEQHNSIGLRRSVITDLYNQGTSLMNNACKVSWSQRRRHRANVRIVPILWYVQFLRKIYLGYVGYWKLKQ